MRLRSIIVSVLTLLQAACGCADNPPPGRSVAHPLPKGYAVPISELSTGELNRILFALRKNRRMMETNTILAPPEFRTFISTQAVMEFNRANRILRFELDQSRNARTFSSNELIFRAEGRRAGFYYSIHPKNGEGSILIQGGRLVGFYDDRFTKQTLQEKEPLRLEALKQSPDYLTTALAKDLARDTLRRLGYADRQIESLGRVVVIHARLDEKVSLPLYIVQYVPPDEDTDESISRTVELKFLGVVPGGKLIGFFDASLFQPQLPLPEQYVERTTNYWQSLGLKTPLY